MARVRTLAVTAVTALLLGATGVSASAAPAPAGTPGTGCAQVDGWRPRQPEGTPRVEAVPGGGGISVITENVQGALPSCAAGTWTFAIPGTSTAYSRRRLEVEWGPHNGTSAAYDGTTLAYRARMAAHLGAPAGPGTGAWHVLWQFIGAQPGGSWTGPSLALVVHDGALYLEGGQRFADGRAPRVWSRELAPYRDDTYADIQVTALLSTTPGRGWVDVRIGDRTVVSRWSPRLEDGTSVPTLPAGLTEIQHRSGLYRGGGSGGVGAQGARMTFLPPVGV